MDRKKIALLVDDDEDFLAQQKISLDIIGLEVVTAHSRAEAETYLETNTPDIAIIDLMLEELDGGFVLAHHIKAKTPTMPVIIISAVTHERDIAFGAESMGPDKWVKADVILSKPARFEQLKREIERLLP
jgi:DNA-binding response OmpR family regulator